MTGDIKAVPLLAIAIAMLFWALGVVANVGHAQELHSSSYTLVGGTVVPSGGTNLTAANGTLRALGVTAGQAAAGISSNASHSVKLVGGIWGVIGLGPLPHDTGHIHISPETLDFGDVDLGESSAGLITITNTGDGDLTVAAIEFSPTSALEFTIDSAPLVPFALGPDATADILLRFTPTSAPLKTGTLEVSSDDPDMPLALVELAGSGVSFDDQAMQILDEVFDPAVEAGTLYGDGPGNSGQGRLGALRNMIEAAGDLIEMDETEAACDQLQDAVNRVDGEFPPPDFIAGPAAPVLLGELDQLRLNLGCGTAEAIRAAAPASSGSFCGLGVELVLLLPLLAAARRLSRQRKRTEAA